MIRTKLRFLYAPLWLLNIIFQFGLFYSMLPKKDEVIDFKWLSLIVLFFVFYLYLFNDILIFRRPFFLKIVASLFFLSVLIYFLLIILFPISAVYILLALLSLFCGIKIISSVNHEI